MDTMFPDISVMRYGIQCWNITSSWYVVITAYTDDELDRPAAKHSFVIKAEDLKVQDLLHVLQEVQMEVAASTP